MQLRIVLGTPTCPPEILHEVERLRGKGLEVAIVPSGTQVSSPYPYPSAVCVVNNEILDEGYGQEGVISLFGRIERKGHHAVR